MSVYIIVEDGEPYPNSYITYESALKVANDKHREELDRQIEDMPEYKNQILEDMNPKENEDGKTSLYIEKGLFIYIYKINMKI